MRIRHPQLECRVRKIIKAFVFQVAGQVQLGFVISYVVNEIG